MTSPAVPLQRRRAFMLAHDHLISPWKYSPAEIKDRDRALLVLNKERQDRDKADLTISAEIPR